MPRTVSTSSSSRESSARMAASEEMARTRGTRAAARRLARTAPEAAGKRARRRVARVSGGARDGSDDASGGARGRAGERERGAERTAQGGDESHGEAPRGLYGGWGGRPTVGRALSTEPSETDDFRQSRREVRGGAVTARWCERGSHDDGECTRRCVESFFSGFDAGVATRGEECRLRHRQRRRRSALFQLDASPSGAFPTARGRADASAAMRTARGFLF